MRVSCARLQVVTLLLAFLCLEGRNLVAEGEPPHVSFEVSGAEGEPGEEVAIDFRGTVRVPLYYAAANFDLSSNAADFIRTDVVGTASAHAPPRGIIYNPTFFRGGYLAGVRMNAQGQRKQIEPGPELVLFRAVFRIRPDAPAGEYAIKITDIEFGAVGIGVSSYSATSELGPVGVLRVREPAGPRPVGGVTCSQSGSRVALDWTATDAYDSILVLRGGAEVASLEGSAVHHEDEPPLGPATYEVKGVRGGQLSLPARCSLLVQVPRPPEVEGVSCVAAEGAVRLSWTNGAAYDSISVFRNGKLLAELDGSAESHTDAWSSDLFTVYTVKARVGGIDTLPVSCNLNALSESFVLWAEEVAAEPGDAGVPIRIYITNPSPTQGIQVALQIDPELVRMRELSVDGTAVDAAEYDFFAYQDFYVPGETVAGIGFDYVPPFGFLLPAGADQHVLTVVVDILSTAPQGTVVPVLFGTQERLFGRPPQTCNISANGGSIDPETRDGAILIGSSPVPRVEGARAEAAGNGDGGGGRAIAAAQSSGILLRWSNGDEYTSLRIERDGKILAEIGGESTSYLDPGPGPGVHRYRIVARKGAKESFPVVVTTHPRGIPGTFLRGDADADGRVSITDAIATLGYLFAGGGQPACLDGADGDDNGEVGITDVLVLLHHLFQGGGALPPPGPDIPWFDTTPDEMACE